MSDYDSIGGYKRPADIEDVIAGISELNGSIENLGGNLDEIYTIKVKLDYVAYKLEELNKIVYSVFELLLMIMVLLIFGWVFSSPGDLVQSLKTFFYYLFNPKELAESIRSILSVLD